MAVQVVSSRGIGCKMLAQDGIRVREIDFPGYRWLRRLGTDAPGLIVFNLLVALRTRDVKHSAAKNSIVVCFGTHCVLASALLSKLLGGRLLVRTHGMDVNGYFSKDINIIRKIFDLFFLKCCNLADVVVTPNGEMAQRLHNFGIKGQIVTIPNGYEEDLFGESVESHLLADSLRLKLGVPLESKVILHIGIKQVKGVATLHEAFKILARDLDDVRLIFVGSGDEMTFRRITGEETHHHEILAGKVPHERIPDYLSTCDVFVSPSYSEAMPTALIEAMAMRRPVVASRIDGHAEIVRDGQDGLLVTPGDPEMLALAIRHLLLDQAFAARCARSGYERVSKNFTKAMVLDRYFELLNRLEREMHKPQN